MCFAHSCRAPLGTWTRVFGDSIIGVPFLRSAFSVYDYVSMDLYSEQPRLGLASTVDVDKAKARYHELYQNRMTGAATSRDTLSSRAYTNTLESN